ncbi:MAG: FHA domain-containing protein [Acidobacteria bacterium]|nr:FHA domain-containing protein [Acidobacteriota bacterium]MCW5949080.1 FHA domain-containing protein [Pyrinomonadaceae bacterium]
MTDIPSSNSGRSRSIDWFVKGILARSGSIIDGFTGRNWRSSSSLAASSLIERIRELLEQESQVVPGKGTVVPHLISIRIQWDKFAIDNENAVESLRNELLVAIADHLNDSVLYTIAPVEIDIKQDYFVSGVKIATSFGNEVDEESEAAVSLSTGTTVERLPAGLADDMQASPSYFEVIVTVLDGTSGQITLNASPGDRFTIGRSHASDITLDDESVSKHHASIRLSDDSAVIADTGSTNGTYVGTERLPYGESRQVMSGQEIRFGDVRTKFEIKLSDIAPSISPSEPEGGDL